MDWEQVTRGVARVMGEDDADRAFRQLMKVVGEDAAKKVVAECYQSAGIRSIDSAEDLMTFGDALVSVGGFIGVVGRSFRVAGICLGAKPA